MKQSTSIYIEHEVLELLKQKNINISRVSEQFFMTLLERGENTTREELELKIKDLRIKIAIQQAEVKDIEQKIAKIDQDIKDAEDKKHYDEVRKRERELSDKAAWARGVF